MTHQKTRRSALGLALTWSLALLAWEEVEAATTECASDADCLAGEFCILALDPPICKPPQEDGAACRRDVVCASGRCDIPEGAEAGVCAPPLCAADTDCAAGSFCILALTPPVCKPPQEDGAACRRDVVCASGRCDIPEGAEAGVCAP
jgi:hypothetical protein